MSEHKFPYHLSFADVIRILQLVDDFHYQELQLELGALRLRVVQETERGLPAQHPQAALASTETQAIENSPSSCEQVVPTAVPRTSDSDEGTPVVAPLAGTFYRSPFPGEPPFVEVGAVVNEGDVLGILEIMKLMNHILAPCSGVVSKICAKNEELVQSGQVLAFIVPGRAT